LSTQISIISGFLGAGKTTFLKKIIPGIKEKIVVIENEFGNVGIDGDIIGDRIPVREIYAGCICCSVVQDFKKAIEELALAYQPDHILIEPSGVGSLSDIIKICKKVSDSSQLNIQIAHSITIVDVSAFDDYAESFGGFYLDQIKNAQIIFLSHFDKVSNEEIEKVISMLQMNNPKGFIVKEDWYSYEGDRIIDILDAMEAYEINLEEKPALSRANKIFNTFPIIAPRIFSKDEIDKLADSLKDDEYGAILRAKGILELDTHQCIHFNFTPYHYHWEYIEEKKETKIVFIGSNLNKEKILGRFR
jgi:G3E family GTPase